MELDLEVAGRKDKEEHLAKGAEGKLHGLDAFQLSESEAENTQPTISAEEHTDANQEGC